MRALFKIFFMNESYQVFGFKCEFTNPKYTYGNTNEFRNGKYAKRSDEWHANSKIESTRSYHHNHCAGNYYCGGCLCDYVEVKRKSKHRNRHTNGEPKCNDFSFPFNLAITRSYYHS